jgi:hypothetical protein
VTLFFFLSSFLVGLSAVGFFDDGFLLLFVGIGLEFWMVTLCAQLTHYFAHSRVEKNSFTAGSDCFF